MDVRFRKSRYFKVIWVAVIYMLIVWFGLTSIPDVDLGGTFDQFLLFTIALFIGFIFLFLLPITTNVWLSKTFRQKGCFVKMTKVSIPKTYASFIKNDKKHGYRYELMTNLLYNNSNSNMNTYYKFQTHKLYVIKCIQNRQIKNAKQTMRLYCSTFTLITMIYVILHSIGMIIFYMEYDPSANWISSLIFQSIMFGIPCIMICIMSDIGLQSQYDFRLVDVYHYTIIVTYLYTSNFCTLVTCVVEYVGYCFWCDTTYAGYWIYNWMNIDAYILKSYLELSSEMQSYVIFETFVERLLQTLFLISLIYVMIISLIARYTIGPMVVFAVFMTINFKLNAYKFSFYGYTNVLAGQVQVGDLWQVLIEVLWYLMIFILLSLMLYIKFHPQSKNKQSRFYQLNTTIAGIFSAMLDYVTDIIVIVFWFVSKDYFYAIFEIIFIVIGQIASALYINDIVVHPNKYNESYFVRILLGLGIGRVYFGIIPWNDNETIKARYKMCKVWEMLFESMPSVGLSCYAILVNSINNNTSRNTSAIISMIFSFINITTTIVSLLDIQHQQNSKQNSKQNKLTVLLTDQDAPSPRIYMDDHKTKSTESNGDQSDEDD